MGLRYVDQIRPNSTCVFQIVECTQCHSVIVCSKLWVFLSKGDHPQNKTSNHACRTDQGTTLRAIEARSGCKINLPESRNDSRKEVTVTLTGSSQERQLGKTIIKELVELGFSPKLKPGMKMHTVSVSTRYAREFFTIACSAELYTLRGATQSHPHSDSCR